MATETPRGPFARPTSMIDSWDNSRRRAFVGFLVGAGTASLLDVVVFGETWQASLPSLIGTGIGFAFAFYLVAPGSVPD